MGDRVGHAAWQKPARTRHSLVADHDEIGTDRRCDRNDPLRRATIPGVRPESRAQPAHRSRISRAAPGLASRHSYAEAIPDIAIGSAAAAIATAVVMVRYALTT
jgi:hypothetical protein